MVVDSAKKQYIFECAFTVKRAKYELPALLDTALNTLTPGSLSFKFANRSPVFNNLTVNASSPLLSTFTMYVDVDGSVKLCYGMSWDKGPEGFALKEGWTLEQRKSYYYQCSYKWAVQSQTIENVKSGTATQDEFHPFTGLKGNMKLCAGLLAKWTVTNVTGPDDEKDGGWKKEYKIKGDAWVAFDIGMSYSWTHYFVVTAGPVPIPVYVGFDWNFSVRAGAEIGVNFDYFREKTSA